MADSAERMAPEEDVAEGREEDRVEVPGIRMPGDDGCSTERRTGRSGDLSVRAWVLGKGWRASNWVCMAGWTTDGGGRERERLWGRQSIEMRDLDLLMARQSIASPLKQIRITRANKDV